VRPRLARVARPLAFCVLLLGGLSFAALAQADDRVRHLMRWADVRGDTVVFTYEDDLWLAPTAGGTARRLTRHEGAERYAKVSPDGSRIAFTGQYDGGADVYVMDVTGGTPRRLTWYPAVDRVLGWTPDGDILFRSSRRYPFRGEELYRVRPDGGTPVRLPVDRAGLASLSPDGRRIAYNRISREDRTWKRYEGGMAQDIWVGSLDEREYRPVTEWEGTDSYPMWHGEAIYFTSDRSHGTLNLFRYHLGDGTTTALTDSRDYDVKYPSLGDGRIVYQQAERLHLLDVATGESRPLEIVIPTDRTRTRTEWVGVSEHTGRFAPSPSGARLLLEARGEILTLPVDEGEPAAVTSSSGSREKSPAWSPDGAHIAFISDRTGEEELYLVDQRGRDDWRQLTRGGAGLLLPPTWSPDSRYLLYSDKRMRLNLLDVESGDAQVIAQGELDDAWERWGIQDYVFSPDSRFIAYTKMEPPVHESIFLYDIEQGSTERLTDRWHTDWSPSFDPDGRYLYFLSQRSLDPIMGRVDQNHVFLDVTRPYMILLRDEPSPFLPEEGLEPTGDGGNDGEESAAADDEPRTVIDRAGLERRLLAVPGVAPGNYFRLEAVPGGFLYLERTDPEFLKYQEVGDTTPGRLDLWRYAIDEQSATKLLAGVNNYHLTPDGTHLAYRAGDTFGVIASAQPAEVGQGQVDVAGMRIKVDRQAEYRQIFDEAWRVQRDWFYDAGLHGVDWARIGDKYRRFLPDVGDRSDLNYLIGEMIAELNAGHTYVFGGDRPDPVPDVPVGLLGADLVPDRQAGYHRIERIVSGPNWRESERSPLLAPGCDVAEGDWLMAIDGEPATADRNVYGLLENKADGVVIISFAKRPSPAEARTCRLKPLRSERPLRYRAWVEERRRRVEQASDGRLGYIHLPDMMQRGLIEFARGFYPQYDRQGLVIDVRYNGGGFVGDMIIDRLERRVWSMTQPREGQALRNPERAFHGPMAVLINQDTGSNGEYFARAIQIKQMAPLIGTRTWGGAVGIEPHQDLVDRGLTTPPQFGLFSLEGEWLIEGRGVEPDIPVRNMPGDVLAGEDAQLERAIDLLLEQITSEPAPLPQEPPPYPDKSKPRG
jgi:tricorn protease